MLARFAGFLSFRTEWMNSIREGRPDPSLFEHLKDGKGRYFHGVALHLTGQDNEAREEWRKIHEGRWAWKAAAELARDGPFVRGFEIYTALPEDALQGLPTSTTVPRKTAEPALAVRYLLQTQRAKGSWDDSHYHFGGDDSLPNVYMAITALAARALREWGKGEAVEGAIARAEKYMRNPKMIAWDDTDEIVWAHAYRLLYFSATQDKSMMARLIRLLGDLQRKNGVWYHEYSNPFVTASVLHVLDEAKKSGADVPAAMLKRGTSALEACRNKSGVISYSFPGRGGRVEGAAGRMPLCELALFLNGRSTEKRVKQSLATSFKHHALLEVVRKYDDHADRFQNGRIDQPAEFLRSGQTRL